MKRICLLAALFLPVAALSQDVTGFVDPFIGTAHGGNTFPGAVLPWGMVSVSPHTAPGSPSGYLQGERYFYGFGHVHLSGTGCADLGSVILTATRGPLKVEPEEYRSTYGDERAEPGFYGVTLSGPDVYAGATVSRRCGFTQFVSRRDGALNILIDAGRSLALQGGGAVAFVSDTEAQGYNISGGFCGEANRQTVYFVARFSMAPASRGSWMGTRIDSALSLSAPDSSIGCWLQYQSRKGDTISVKVGISYVSIDNARKNLEQEIPGWNFDRVRSDARSAWQQELEKIRVTGESRDNMVKFYTALYHALIHPNTINDANGEFPLMGRKGTGRYTDRDRYTVFSLWDTYRTLHPLLALAYPERQSAIVRTMIDMYKESGWLPKWELAGNETHMMVGDGAVPVIVDTYLKGISDFDSAAAYEAITKPAITPGPEVDPARPGYHEYLRYGYIPFEQDTTQAWWVWGPASTTLEYCFADWTTAQMARKLGNMPDAQEFSRRASFYKNLFDSTSDFVRPRRMDGSWLTPFDPLKTEGSGSWSGSGGPGYVEGNAWQYTWFVPHDIKGLAALFRGPARLEQKLLECFSNGQFTINNEPDIAYPYLFTYFPDGAKTTRRLVREIMEKQFSTGPGGLPGNDDAGTISAWYVFSALGFYPCCPGSNTYQLGNPLFSSATIMLNPHYYPGKRFVITADNQARAAENATVSLNGKRLPGYQIRHGNITAGGRLTFTAGK